MAHEPNVLRKLLVFLRRDLAIAASYRLAWSLQLGEIMLTVAAFFYLGRLVDESSPPTLVPYPDYFSFALVGIAVFNYFFISLNNFTQALRESQLTGTLEALLVTRTSAFAIFLYSHLAILLAQLLRWITYLLVAVLAYHLSLERAAWGAVFVLLALGMLTFLGLGLFSASFILAFKKGDPLNWILATVTWLVSGTLFPVEILPSWLRFVSRLFPVTPLLTGMRKALLLGAGVVEVKVEAITLAGFAILLLAGGYGLLRWALRRARCEGSLGHY